MLRRRALLLVGVLLTLSVSGLAPRPESATRAVETSLPERLSDKQFWSLVAEMSEPDGFFRSDNLVSNEI